LRLLLYKGADLTHTTSYISNKVAFCFQSISSFVLQNPAEVVCVQFVARTSSFLRPLLITWEFIQEKNRLSATSVENNLTGKAIWKLTCWFTLIHEGNIIVKVASNIRNILIFQYVRSPFSINNCVLKGFFIYNN